MLRGLNFVKLLGQVEFGSNFTVEDFTNVSFSLNLTKT